MKATFKPLSLAVAVASAGYTGMVNAQSMDLAAETGLGDLALVPFYTVNAEWSTGVSVINTSEQTQVIKIRMRRAKDSMDALDFNVVLSPEDVWTGYAQRADENDASGEPAIRWYTNDLSCTVPALTDGYLEMPTIYREGAESGYLEVLAMGAASDESQPIAVGALHGDDGEPEDCDLVRENFKRGTSAEDYAATVAGISATRRSGVVNSGLTIQPKGATGREESAYVASGNALRVSYFIRDDASGTEFGNAAVHISDFLDGPSITNQRQGINEGDLQGFDHPNLQGGAPTSFIEGWGGPVAAEPATAATTVYEDLRNLLGTDNIINDWSANSSGDLFSVNTDWVVTTPGQYLMTRLDEFIDSLEPEGTPCLAGVPTAAYDPVTGANCDFRDIPMRVSAEVWSREEEQITATPDDLVVSPAPPTPDTPVNFDREVNVVQWGEETVINEDQVVEIPVPAGAFAGWATIQLEQWSGTTQGICDFTDYGASIAAACVTTDSPIPLIGFVAWERNFGDQPDANFGRIVEHAYVGRGASSAP
jgi:hypothetical protein